MVCLFLILESSNKILCGTLLGLGYTSHSLTEFKPYFFANCIASFFDQMEELCLKILLWTDAVY